MYSVSFFVIVEVEISSRVVDYRYSGNLCLLDDEEASLPMLNVVKHVTPPPLIPYYCLTGLL